MIVYRVWHESGDLIVESPDVSEIKRAMRDAILSHLQDDPCRGCGVLTLPEHHGFSVQACRGDQDVTGDPTVALPYVPGAVAQWVSADADAHADSDTVAQDVANGELSDASALAVASWWQSPGTDGRYLAQFASTGEAPVEGLIRDIRSVLADLGRWGQYGTFDYRCVELLAAWVRDRQSR